MMGLFAGLKILRSGAFFSKALTSGGRGDLVDKWKNNANGFRGKVILSGIIFGTTAAIAGRTIYRAVKRGRNASKKRKQEKQAQQEIAAKQARAAQSRKEIDEYRASKPDSAAQSGPVSQAEPEKETSPFEWDLLASPRTDEIVKHGLVVMQYDDDNDIPNSYKVVGLNNTYYVNGSGVFTKDHQNLLENSQDKLKLSLLMQDNSEKEYDDILTIASALD